MSAVGTEPLTVISRDVGRLHGESRPIKLDERFVLAGVGWLHPQEPGIELRALGTDHRWGRWMNAAVTGHDTDGGRAPAPVAYGEPVWTGPAIAVQLRSAQPVSGVTVHLVPARRHAGRLAGEVADAASASHLRGSAARLTLAAPSLPAGPGQPPIIARSVWAGRHHRPRVIPEYGDVRMAFVHHSDGGNAYSRRAVPEILLSIYQFHVQVRGWNDIGYNFAIDRFGRIWEARAGGIDQAVVGAQAGGYNLESTGVVILGTYSQALPSAQALRALEHLLAWKLSLHGVPVTGRVTVEVDPPDAYFTRFRPGQHVHLPRIAGHRDGCTTDCPGNRLYHHLPAVRAAAAKLAGDQARLTLRFGGGAVKAPRDEKRRHATYLRLASARITVGDQVPISGELRTLSGKPVAGAPVQVQGVLGDTERTLRTLTTDAHGRWSAALAPRSNVLVRALHSVAPAAASPLVAIGVAPQVTCELVDRAEQLFRGTVTPHKAHMTLTIHYAHGRHKLVEHVHVPVHHGKFHHRLKLKRGRYVVQAHSIADEHHIPAAAKPIRLTVR